MTGKRSREAYVEIDHRNSPGLPPEIARFAGLDPAAVGPGQVFKSAIAICHICGADMILQPNRSRQLLYCMRHNAYSCETCVKTEHETGVPHTTYEQKLERYYNALVKGEPIKEL